MHNRSDEWEMLERELYGPPRRHRAESWWIRPPSRGRLPLAHDPAGAAVASLVLGLISLAIWPLGLLALACGWEPSRPGARVSPAAHGLAVAGFLLGLLTSTATLYITGLILYKHHW